MDGWFLELEERKDSGRERGGGGAVSSWRAGLFGWYADVYLLTYLYTVLLDFGEWMSCFVLKIDYVVCSLDV